MAQLFLKSTLDIQIHVPDTRNPRGYSNLHNLMADNTILEFIEKCLKPSARGSLEVPRLSPARSPNG